MASNNTSDDLLARLSALKAPSKVPKTAKSSAPHPSIKPADVQDDIAARFRRLASGSAPVDPKTLKPIPPTKSDDDVADLPSERVHNNEDDQSLDDLLKELGEDEKSWMQVSEEDKISNLLKEAEEALPRQEDVQKESTVTVPRNRSSEHDLRDADVQDNVEVDARQEQKDEEDADEYIAQVMADIELRRQQGTLSEDESEPGSDEKTQEVGRQTPARDAREATPFDDLPSAPSTAPVLANIDNSELELRFASLSLPATPSNKPTSKKPASSSKAKSSLPTYTDEDIESWCVICNEDATVRCLGCDGDLYCQECWNEGHRSPEAGYDERKHKAVVYSREHSKKKLAAAAAS